MARELLEIRFSETDTTVQIEKFVTENFKWLDCAPSYLNSPDKAANALQTDSSDIESLAECFLANLGAFNGMPKTSGLYAGMLFVKRHTR